MYAPQINIALRAAREAGRMIRNAAEDTRRFEVTKKGHNDFVSEVDHASEAILVRALQKAYPDHAIRAEEQGLIPGNNGESEWEWVIDPLDGTTNFLHDFPQYCISMALKHKGRLEHAVIYDPLREEEFTASRGRGALLNGRRIRVSNRKGLEGALLGTGFPFRKDQEKHLDAYMAMLREFIGVTSGIRRPGSAALDLAWVAAGRMDGFFEIGLQEWDIAGGCLLITEAGGLVGDLSGGHEHLNSGNIVGGAPKVFKAMLQTIQPHLGGLLKK